jgi:hypothetical protein
MQFPRWMTMLVVVAASALSLQCDATPDRTKAPPPLCDDVVALDNLGRDPYLMAPAELRTMGASRDALVERIRTRVPEWTANLSVLHLSTERLQRGDLTILDDPSALESLRQVRYAATQHCDFETLKVTATDFRYDVPPTVVAGRTLIEVENRGDKTHLLMLLRNASRADGRPLERAVAFMRDHRSSRTGSTPGRLAGDPGPVTPPRDTDAHLYRLDRGAYLWFCPIHATQGMVGEFTVE